MRLKAGVSKSADKLIEVIEERILTGVYPPNMRVDEEKLSEEFNVSRTPVREAITHLISIGLLVKRPRHSALIAFISAKTLFEMFEVLAELEALSAKLASRRITILEQERLKQVHNDCKKALDDNNTDLYYSKNEEWHKLIYQSSHNIFLINQIDSLNKRLKCYRRIQLKFKNRMISSFKEHEEILNAILAGDGVAAADKIRAHIMVQGERFTDLVSTIQMN